MTVYDKPPKTILNSTNYKTIYFSLNSSLKTLYPKYKVYIDSELSDILDMIKFEDEHK
jgi:hypothetical protein